MSPAQANQPLPSGFALEGYRIERQLSLGGFSIVYLATDAHGKTVAIKEYLPNSLALRAGENPSPVISPVHRRVFDHGLSCFFEEGQALTLLDHPNVVRVIDFLRANGTAYLVMRYEHGHTLLEHIHKHPNGLDENFIRWVFSRLLGGLRAVHSHRLLHLDLKPANIYLRMNGSPVLLDFGAARQVIGNDAPLLRAMRTPGYAAPEQGGPPEGLGPWTDIYAVGATLYTCLGGDTPPAAEDRLVEDKCIPASQRWAGQYSQELLQTVDACMALDPLARPQSVHALQKLLDSEERSFAGTFDKLRLKVTKWWRR